MTLLSTVQPDKEPTPLNPQDSLQLRPWASLGWLQGRVHPRWEIDIAALLQDRGKQGGSRAATAATIRHLLRASLHVWYTSVWLPRCQRTTEQERREGLRQGTKIRRMQAARGRVPREQP